VVVCGLGTALYLLDQIETPHPYVYSPETAAARLLRVNEGARWKAIHGYGALCAETLELQEIGERGLALPVTDRKSFYDGAAHHQRDPLDDLAGRVDEIRRYIPANHHELFFDGLMKAIAFSEAEDPDLVMIHAEELEKLTRSENLFNGIRIGLQERFGDDMRRATDLAARYPDRVQPALFEELGWRWGDEHALEGAAWLEFAARIPEAGRCSFAEGMIRGRLLRAFAEDLTWWPEIAQFMKTIDTACHDSCISGIAEAVLISATGSGDAASAAIGRVDDEAVRTEVRAVVRRRIKGKARRAWQK